MSRKRTNRGQGSIYKRNDVWWCNYNLEEALACLHRKQGRLASGELLARDRVSVRDLLHLLLEEYDVRKVSQTYIATLRFKSILLPKLGTINATKLSSAESRSTLKAV